MQAPYEQPINTNFPGFFVILIDQSLSMEEDFGGTPKHVFAANAINRVIYEIRSAAAEGTEIKDRCYVVVIGYGAETKVHLAHKTSELKKQILRVEEQSITQMDGSSIVLRLPIYLEPKAANGTPMDAAFDKAYDLAAGFCRTNSNCFPPVVINITDGKPNDLQNKENGQKTRNAARRLQTLKTLHGDLLLFNAHIGDYDKGSVLLPSEKSQLNDPYAEYLYEITSPIPKPLFKNAELVGFSPKLGARGLVYNADSNGFIQLLNFGGSTMAFD